MCVTKAWPSKKELGAYSYPIKDKATQIEMWDYLINKLDIAKCPSLSPRLSVP
jgi:hypothetical protein